jgi:hypothetical protein
MIGPEILPPKNLNLPVEALIHSQTDLRDIELASALKI